MDNTDIFSNLEKLKETPKDNNIKFNFSNYNYQNNEYDLFGNQTEEVIRLYGIPGNLILKTQEFDNVFGNYKDLSDFIFDKQLEQIYFLPENTEGFEGNNSLYSQFGLLTDLTINLFVSCKSIPNLESKDLVGSIIVLPSNKVLEITEVELSVPGANNMFLFNRIKNCFKLFCKSYNFNIKNYENVTKLKAPETSQDLLDENNNKKLKEDFDRLDKYFDELCSKEIPEIPDISEIPDNSKPKINNLNINNRNKLKENSVIDKSKEDVFNGF